MGNERVYNFSAGPSMLPLEVLERAGAEITNYQGSGMSVMEMSHRSKVFQKIFDDTKAKLRALLNVPEGYQILFLQGGASTQFSMAPLNLIGATGKADYAVTGNFSNIAYKEAQKYGQIHLAASSADKNHTTFPSRVNWSWTLRPAISTTAPTTPSTAPSGSMSRRRAACPSCATCPPTSSPAPWTCPSTASSSPAPRRTWPLPA